MEKFLMFLVSVMIISTAIAIVPAAHAESNGLVLTCQASTNKCFPEWVTMTTIYNIDGSSISKAPDMVLCVTEGCFNLIRDTRRPGIDVVLVTPVGTQTALPSKVLACQRSTGYCLPYIEISTIYNPDGSSISKAPDLVIGVSQIIGDFKGGYFNLVLDTRYEGLGAIPWSR